MKRKLAMLCTAVLICATSLFSQNGAWGYTDDASASNVHKIKLMNEKGLRAIYRWSEIEPTKGAYNFTEMRNDIQRFKDSGLVCMLQIMVGPDAPIKAPHTWLKDEGVETYMTDDNETPGPFPNYYNAKYTTAYYKLQDTAAKFLKALPTDLKAVVKSLFINCGTTGDIEPHHGNPIGTSYGISKGATWYAYTHVLFDSAIKYNIPNTFLKLAFNPDNDARDLTYFRTKVPGLYYKAGNPTHKVPLDGAQLYPARLVGGGIPFGEIQGPAGATTIQKVRFAVCYSAMNVGEKVINFPLNWQNVTAITDFVNTHVDDDVTLKRGWLVPADIISIDSTGRFSEAQFGNLIGNTAAYNQRINGINKDATKDELYKQDLRFEAMMANVNPARVANIHNNSGTNATYSSTSLSDNDFAFGAGDNFGVNITQRAIRSTCNGVYNFGPDTSIYGRFGVEYNIVNGKGEMFFALNNGLKVNSGKNKITISVVYLDEGNGHWSIDCMQCQKRQALKVDNTNTGQFKTASVTIDGFVFGQTLLNGSDFTLKYLGGSNTKYALITVDNLNK